ncbi:MAG: 23S rRNA (guanosine(2251)-2'-O)-methyltransferase RlmB [Desulfurivibrio sp.]
MKKQRRHTRDTGNDTPANTTMIWGFHPVSELLRRRPALVLTVFLAPERDDARVRSIAELAAQHRVRVEYGLPPEQAEINAHQGVAALAKAPPPLSLSELLTRTTNAAPLLLMLDSLQDPHNMGAVIRSAAAFGVSGVIIPKDRSAPLTGTVMKAAAGTLPLVEICQVTNLADSLRKLKEQGFWIYGAAGDAPATIYQADFNGPICLVVGNEQKGIRPLLRSHCDFLISIPLAAGIESLNVSVAAGIMLAEIRRRRLPPSDG